MPAGSTYTQITTTSLGSAQSSVTLSGISGSYTDLILIINGGVSGTANTWLRLNNDSGTNYSGTLIYGQGTTAASFRRTNDSLGILLDAVGPAANGTQLYIIQFQNYSNTTTFKSAITRTTGANQETVAAIGLWRNTSAINSITIYPDNSRTWNTGATFSLYGITAA